MQRAATALAVSYAGATPVFVEPEIETYNIDVTKYATLDDAVDGDFSLTSLILELLISS